MTPGFVPGAPHQFTLKRTAARLQFALTRTGAGTMIAAPSRPQKEPASPLKIYAFDLLPWPYLEAPSYYPDPNSLFDPVRATQLYNEHLEQMAAYEDHGFDAVCINEHHAKPYGLMPSPNLIAAALSQRTRRIKIGILGNLAALHDNPIRLAEEIAMLDCMSGGRIISGFVRGVPQEYLALSGSLADSRGRLREAWDLIVRAWTEREPFAWHGAFFDYDRVSIWPRPLQQPHPAIILPAESDEGLELAAERRVPTGAAYRSIARTKSTFDRYRAFAAAHGWQPGPDDCHILRHVYVAESNERARSEAEPHLDYFWHNLLSYHRGAAKLLAELSPPASTLRPTGNEPQLYELAFDQTQRDGMTIVGDPDYVTEQIEHQFRDTGAGVLMGLFQFGSLPHALVKRNVELFAREVMPRLRQLAAAK
jgi:alkanesulfonate monooxygenase SsuD/methylene tetrahydromethanopterin reductase-like flavin-dependent oxidoreductase (luciferase family)